MLIVQALDDGFPQLGRQASGEYHCAGGSARPLSPRRRPCEEAASLIGRSWAAKGAARNAAAPATRRTLGDFEASSRRPFARARCDLTDERPRWISPRCRRLASACLQRAPRKRRPEADRGRTTNARASELVRSFFFELQLFARGCLCEKRAIEGCPRRRLRRSDISTPGSVEPERARHASHPAQGACARLLGHRRPDPRSSRCSRPDPTRHDAAQRA